MKHIALLSLTFALLVGCAGDDYGHGSLESAAFASGNGAVLVEVPREAWQVATAGCEDSLAQAEAFGIAAGQPELVVAFDQEGNIECVDSYASIESELQLVSPDSVDTLWLGYLGSLRTLQNTTYQDAAPDPSNSEDSQTETAETIRNLAGDPEPRPNLGLEWHPPAGFQAAL